MLSSCCTAIFFLLFPFLHRFFYFFFFFVLELELAKFLFPSTGKAISFSLFLPIYFFRFLFLSLSYNPRKCPFFSMHISTRHSRVTFPTQAHYTHSDFTSCYYLSVSSFIFICPFLFTFLPYLHSYLPTYLPFFLSFSLHTTLLDFSRL